MGGSVEDLSRVWITEVQHPDGSWHPLTAHLTREWADIAVRDGGVRGFAYRARLYVSADRILDIIGTRYTESRPPETGPGGNTD